MTAIASTPAPFTSQVRLLVGTGRQVGNARRCRAELRSNPFPSPRFLWLPSDHQSKQNRIGRRRCQSFLAIVRIDAFRKGLLFPSSAMKIAGNYRVSVLTSSGFALPRHIVAYDVPLDRHEDLTGDCHLRPLVSAPSFETRNQFRDSFLLICAPHPARCRSPDRGSQKKAASADFRSGSDGTTLRFDQPKAKQERSTCNPPTGPRYARAQEQCCHAGRHPTSATRTPEGAQLSIESEALLQGTSIPLRPWYTVFGPIDGSFPGGTPGLETGRGQFL
jgi:hypothetical protein